NRYPAYISDKGTPAGQTDTRLGRYSTTSLGAGRASRGPNDRSSIRVGLRNHSPRHTPDRAEIRGHTIPVRHRAQRAPGQPQARPPALLQCQTELNTASVHLLRKAAFLPARSTYGRGWLNPR